MYYVYVFQSEKDKKFYIGFTKDLKLRLARLNAALQPSFAGFNWGDSNSQAQLLFNRVSEGFDRGSNKEFIQYLIISRGSVSEVKSLSYAVLDIGYITNESFEKISERCLKITSLINGFIRYLKSTDRKR